MFRMLRRAVLSLIIVVIVLTFCGKVSSRRRTSQSRRKPSSMEISDSSSLSQESVPSYATYEYLTKYYTFSCDHRVTGYYGDPLYDCRIFHVCHASGRDTFFCPAWTRFNNYLQICDWPQKIDKNCEPFAVKEEPEYDRYSHPIDHYPLPPVPLTVKYVPVPKHVSVTSEEQHYRNKYKEVQEYYGPFKAQHQRNLKLEIAKSSKGPLILLPQPVFNYVSENLKHYIGGKEFYQEDEQSKQSREIAPPSSTKTVIEADKSAESKLTKYGNEQSIIQIPPSDNIQILQTGTNRQQRSTEGKISSPIAATKTTGWKGNGRATEMGPYLTLNNNGLMDGSVIELWIPTKVRKISSK